jgi:hypothetical protein
MNSGFLPGDSLQDRLAVLAEPQRVRALIPGLRAGMNAFLGKAVEVVRSRFGGKVSYASLPFEGVDWGPFDIIATDAGYRTAEMAARFRDDIRAFVAQGRALGKPVAITEFGCATYRGAADLGNRDDSMIEWGDSAQAVRLKGDFTRDEDEQARSTPFQERSDAGRNGNDVSQFHRMHGPGIRPDRSRVPAGYPRLWRGDDRLD